MVDEHNPLVFISHSSADRDVAVRLCEALERRGLGCWIASRDIRAGENFQEAIVRAIGLARAMVLVFTGNANNSGEIKKELALASQSHLVVIPLRIEDVLPNDAFRYEFSTRQWIDAFEDWDSAMDNLVAQVSAAIGAPASAPATPAPATSAPAPAAEPARRRVLAAAVVAVLAGAGGFGYWVLGRAGGIDVSGAWVTDSIPNPYSRNDESTLEFAFEQDGEDLFGTVTEISRFGGYTKDIFEGSVRDGRVVFHTRGTVVSGSSEQPYKEHYRGTLEAGAIAFSRQNDVSSGGVRQTFTARRQP